MPTYVVGSEPGDDYATIAAALAAVSTGDTLEMRAEVFNESGLSSSAAQLTFRAHSSAGNSYWIVDGGGATANGFTFKNGWSFEQCEVRNLDGNAFEKHAANGNDLDLTDVYIHDVKTGVNRAQKGTFDRVRCFDCTRYGLDLDEESIVTRCIVARFGTDGPSYAGIRTQANSVVECCTVWGVSTGDTGINVAGATSQAINNLVTSDGNGNYGILFNSGSGVPRGNYVWGTWATAAISGGAHSGAHATDTVATGSAAEPVVTDSAADNYRPLGTSPHIADGWTPSQTTTDFDGVAYTQTRQLTKSVNFVSGSSQYVAVSPTNIGPALGSGDFSVAMWVKPDVLSGFPMLFAVNTSVYGNRFQVFISASDGTVTIADSVADQIDSPSYAVTTGFWSHIVATHNSSTNATKLYVDGAEVGTATVTGFGTFAASDLFSFGTEYDPGPSLDNYFDGKIAEIAVWDSELSSSDVAELVADKSPVDMTAISAAADIIAHWQMGDGDTHPTLTDRLGIADGTMTNMAPANIIDEAPLTNPTPGAFAAPAFGVDSATAPDRNTVEVTFTQAPDVASVNSASKWTVTATDGGADVSATEYVGTSGSVSTISVFPGLTPGKTYTVTVTGATSSGVAASPASATFTISNSLVLSSSGFDADWSYGPGIIEVIIRAAGQELQSVAGGLVTKTVEDFGTTATELFVESTYNWPSSGRFWAGRILFTYTGKKSASLTGVSTTYTRVTSVTAGTTVVLDVATLAPEGE